MSTTNEIKFSDEDYKKAAVKWEKEFLLMPILACSDILKYATGVPNLRGKKKWGASESKAQFAPYSTTRVSKSDLKVVFREMETFFGNVTEKFVPDDYLLYLIGQNAGFLGDSQKNALSAKMVIAAVSRSLGEHLREVLFSAVRNGDGDETKDLFDGWMTIIRNEIAEGNIAESKENFIDLGEDITSANAVDILKEIDRSCHKILRGTQKFIYTSPEVADAYNDNYLLTHSGIIYNNKFDQPVVEGSAGKTVILPLDVLSGTDMSIVTTKNNLLYGYDSMSDTEKMQVDRFDPWELTLSAAMWFGTGIRSIDKRMFKVVKHAKKAEAPKKDDETSNETENQ